MERKFFIFCLVCLVVAAIVLGVRNARQETPPNYEQPKDEILGDISEFRLFYVALNDNGKLGPKIGCDDSIVPVTRSIPRTIAPLAAALDILLSDKRSTVETGLYNSLYQSNLSIESVTIANTVATVRLSGSVSLGGVCDMPRFKAQLEETALQFETVSKVDIFINGESIDEALSQQ